MMDTPALLAERHETHGDFTDVACVTRTTQAIFRSAPNWKNLNAAQSVAIDMIAMKIARITCGDANVADHWADIAGYARLALDRIKKV